MINCARLSIRLAALGNMLALTVGLAVANPAPSAHSQAPQLSRTEQRSIQQQISAHQHRWQPQADGSVLAANPSQHWAARFDTHGRVQINGADWQLGLQLDALGYGQHLQAPDHTPDTPPLLSMEDERLYYRWSPQLTEWWTNGSHGLEQWFRLERPPKQRQGQEPLVLRLALQGDYQAQGQGDAVTLHPKHQNAGQPPVLQYHKLKAWDAQGRPVPGLMRGEGEYITLELDDRHAQYPLTIDPVLAQQAYIKASNAETFDQFGWSIAASGDTLVVGAPYESSSATGIDDNQTDNSSSGSGAAYVFVRSGTTWIQQAYLKASNTNAGDRFGWSVAISGDTLAVGAYREKSNATGINGNQTNNSALSAGAVYVFVRSSSTWSQQAYIKASNTDAMDEFGWAVALSVDTLVVGAPHESANTTGVNGFQGNNTASQAGAAYVFVRSGSTWSQQAYLKASNTDAGDQFGSSVAISGDTVVVGAPYEAANTVGVNGFQGNNTAGQAGAAYVFVRSGSSWSQQAYLKASNTDAGDGFGWSVAISNDTVVAGAPFEASSATGVNGNQADNSASQAGAAYVFVRSGNTWIQQAYLKASNTKWFHEFGWSVAIAGDTLVIGACQESSNATGVNGNQGDTSVNQAGAAYLFVRSGSTWSQQAYLKASNTDAYDLFGWSVAISGNTPLVSAVNESSNATGINGDQTDNSANQTGAVYAFALNYLSGTPGPASEGSPYSFTPTLGPGSVPPPVTYSISAGALPPGLALDSATGAVTGTPTTAGSYSFTLRATNAGGIDDLPVSVSVSGPASVPPVLSGTPDPATVGAPYNFTPTLGPANVTLPVGFSISAGALPPGLALDSATGAVTGTPTTAGSYSFTLRAANAGGIDDLPVSVTVNGPASVPPVLSGTPDPATVGAPYNFTPTLGPANVTLPVGFSISVGTLPTGLVLDPGTGAITGTPTTAGSYSFTLRASNAGGVNDLPVTVAVTAPASVAPILSGTPDPATVGAPYNFTPTLGPTGVTQPVTFSISAGALPPGLALNSATGAVTGTPTTAGSYSFTLRATNAGGANDLPVTVAVAASASVPPVLSGTPDPATVGAPYNFTPTLGPANVTLPVGFSISAGALPPGLALDSATGAVTGTPTTAGSYSFTLRATNAGGANDLPVTVAVAAPASVPPVLSGTPDPATAGVAHSFTPTLGPAEVTQPVTFSISAGALPPGLVLDPATGAITGTPTTAGSYSFTLRATNTGGAMIWPSR